MAQSKVVAGSTCVVMGLIVLLMIVFLALIVGVYFIFTGGFHVWMV